MASPTNYVHFENDYFHNNPACSFSTITLNSIPLTVMDTTISLTTSIYPFILTANGLVPVSLNVTGTIICISSNYNFNSLNSFQIYPNPADENITVELDANGLEGSGINYI